MAGPSLSHILDPLRPAALATGLDAAPEFAQRAAISVGVPVAGPSSGSAAASSAVPSQAHDVPAAASSSSTPQPGQAQQASASAAKSHAGNNLYACRDCGRSYSRPEHLVRHVQTHTLGRRFICEICQKSFARKDLLRRHVTNHENDTPHKRRRTATSPGAGRVTQACRPCAVARVKCDESKPCRRCVNRKLTCVASEAGSAAAMHLVHLSANAHTATNEPPPYPNPAPGSGESLESSPASHSQVRSVPGGSLSGQDTATTKSTPLSQTTSYKPEDSQLPTPDTAADQGTIRPGTAFADRV